MTDKEQADYNKAFIKSVDMNVRSVSDEAMELFLREDSDDEFCDKYGTGEYSPLADARGVFWNGYELGLKHAKERSAA